MDVSIIIPVYNGSQLLEKHLTPFLKHLRSRPYEVEIILVDDGSDDATLTMSYANKYELNFIEIGVNKGKGNALREGFKIATGKIQIFTDADIPFQYDNIDEVITLLNEMPDQVAIGDRTDSSSSYFEKSSVLRKLGSNLVSKIVHHFIIPGIKDTQCGLKGMSDTVARKLFSASIMNGFSIDIEIIYLARKFKIPVHKFPVQLRYNDKSTVNVVWDGFKLLCDIFRIRKLHRHRGSDYRSGDKVAITGNYQYQAYYNGKAPQRYWHKFRLDCAIENLNLIEGGEVLDMGCGSGVLCSIIAKNNPRVKVTGVDANCDAILFCNEHWKHYNNVTFCEQKVDQRTHFWNDSVTNIAFLEVIEHITTWQSEKVLEEFYRILKKNGVLVISTPNRKSIWPLLENLLDFFKLTPKLKGEQHEILYSGSELKELVERHGFGIVNRQTVNFIAPWIAIVSKRIAEKIHKWESRRAWIPGSVLVYTFVKKDL